MSTEKHRYNARRNDPCPCGSGTKFKRCCLIEQEAVAVFPVTNAPEPIDHHFGRLPNGEWVKLPGYPCIRLSYTGSDCQIDEVFKMYFHYQEHDHEYFEKLQDCRHKLFAAKYHLGTIKKAIDNEHCKLTEGYKPPVGASYEGRNETIIYETEAFLFQVKSSLDVLTIVTGHLIKGMRNIHGFNHKGEHGTPEYECGGKAINKLRELKHTALADLFERHRTDWIQEMAIWRDEITHKSKLQNFTGFIQEPFTGGETAMVRFPAMPNGERVDTYVGSIFQQLLELHGSVFQLLEPVRAAIPTPDRTE